jgi:predicted RND superfamily exporter protein
MIRRFERIAPAILLLTALAAPLILYGAFRAVQSNTNKVVDWLPASFQETADLAWYRERFAGDQFVIVSWEGAHLGGDPSDPNAPKDDPRIEKLAKLLVPEQDSHEPIVAEGETFTGVASVKHTDPEAPGKKVRYFKNVVTARRLLDRLTAEPLEVPYDEAVERLKGSLLGDDGKQTALVVTLTEEALADFRKAIGRGNEKWRALHHPQGALFDAIDEIGIDKESVHVGGPPVDNVAIDEEGEKTLIRLMGLSTLLGLFLAWRSLKSIKLTIMVFCCGILSAAASLATIWLWGDTTDAVVLAMPSLIYVLAISGAIHIINYYKEAIEEGGMRGAAYRALAHAWKPAAFCSATTAVGLLSLVTSDLTPIRKFGFYSSIGMMLMLGSLFLFLPAALQIWPVRMRRKESADKEAEHAAAHADHTRPENRVEAFWNVVGGFIIRRYALVAVTCTALIAVACVGISRIQTSIDLMGLFDKNARVITDYKWLEAHVGRLVPLEIVLKFDDDSIRRDDGTPASEDARLRMIDRAELVAKVEQALAAKFGAQGTKVIGPSMSATSFMPELPSGSGFQATIRRSVVNTKLESSYDAFKETGYLRSDPETGAELWRISLRVAAFKDVDYGKFSDEVREVVQPILTAANQSRPELEVQVAAAETNAQTSAAQIAAAPKKAFVDATYTGVVPIVYKAQRALLQSLIESTFWSLIVITPMLMFVTRGFWSGIVCMIPNVLPIAFVFGGMGWLDLPVDIGAMMSASIALGVAVDDTIHYLAWFRDEFDRTGDRKQSILYAYRKCALPTMQAAIINGLGLSIFAFSTFTPTKQFGYLMLTILVAGMFAELILLPALLASPLGLAFKRRKIAGHTPDGVDVPEAAFEPDEASRSEEALAGAQNVAAVSTDRGAEIEGRRDDAQKGRTAGPHDKSRSRRDRSSSETPSSRSSSSSIRPA